MKKRKNRNDVNDAVLDNMNTKRINWFPGHMHNTVKKIKEHIKMVDIVLEIRDARSPLATGNHTANVDLGEKNRLIVLNKTNLADPKVVQLWESWFEKQESPFVFINCFDKTAITKIIKLSKKVVHDNRLKSNPECTPKTKLKIMIVGIPNTGKSTIINQLAGRNATKVAEKPGQTQQPFWVNVDKDLQILDTPGVMPPKIDKYEHGLWLSALHAIPDKITKPEDSACYIIEHLQKTKCEIFKERFKLESFDMDLVSVLNQIATLRGCIRQKNQYDYERVYNLILLEFRRGDYGPISFGVPPRKEKPAN